MPTPFIKAMAKKHHKSEKEVEEAWENAKDIVEREYDSVGGKFGLVVKITKRILKIKESVSFAELILAEELVPFKPSKTTSFLQQWSRGDMIAAYRVDDEITAELSKTVQDTTYTLYRGWKFGDHESMYEKMGFHYRDMVVGKKLKLKVEKLRSWSKSKKVAENFSNPKFDSINERVMTDQELDHMGLDHGELIGLSVVIQIKVKAKSVFADLTNVPTRFLEHAHEEQEVILNPGNYTVTIIDVASHVHNSPKHQKAETRKKQIALIHAYASALTQDGPLTKDEIEQYIDHDPDLELPLLHPLVAAVFLLVFGFTDHNFCNKIQKMIDADIIRNDGEESALTPEDLGYFLRYIKNNEDDDLSYYDQLQTQFTFYNKPKKVHKPRTAEDGDYHDHTDKPVDLDDIESDFEMPAGDWEPE